MTCRHEQAYYTDLLTQWSVDLPEAIQVAIEEERILSSLVLTFSQSSHYVQS